jgi:hypothetical protein
MAIIVDLALLIASRREAKPSADRPRLLEVAEVLDGGGEGGRRHDIGLLG